MFLPGEAQEEKHVLCLMCDVTSGNPGTAAGQRFPGWLEMLEECGHIF